MGSPLHRAAAHGQVDRVRQLLAAGADLNAADNCGNTTLFIASREGRGDVVQLLLEAGASVDASAHGNATPLCTAAASGHLEVVQLLLAAGADVNAAESYGYTPLHAATVRRKHHLGQVVQLLLCKGANPQLRDNGGHSALVYAAEGGYTDVVQLLLEAWGQPPVTAAHLTAAAIFAGCEEEWPTFAWLTKELRQLYPSKLQEVVEYVFDDEDEGVDTDITCALAAMLDARASDVSSLDEQWAALHKREEAVAKQQQALQQLVVGVAGIARAAQQDLADEAPAIGVEGKEGASAALSAD